MIIDYDEQIIAFKPPAFSLRPSYVVMKAYEKRKWRWPTHHSSRRAAVGWPGGRAASHRATLRVAQPRAKGRTRLSGRPLGR